jgi:hypothetical protein
MKKPARRNADKALCAYFTSGDRSGKVGLAKRTRLGVYLKPRVSDPAQMEEEAVLHPMI